MTITIETEAQDSGVAVRVIDDGPGIPDEALPRIFEPFFTTKPQGRGHRARARHRAPHRGASTAAGRGASRAPGRTCFEVWLPVGRSAEPRRREAAELGAA